MRLCITIIVIIQDFTSSNVQILITVTKGIWIWLFWYLQPTHTVPYYLTFQAKIEKHLRKFLCLIAISFMWLWRLGMEVEELFSYAKDKDHFITLCFVNDFILNKLFKFDEVETNWLILDPSSFS